jgi:hypothetical protein
MKKQKEPVIKIIRFGSGEEVLLEVVKEDENWITLKKGIIILTGQEGIQFAPWGMVVSTEEPEFTVNKSHIMYTATPHPDAIKQYHDIFEGTAVPAHIEDVERQKQVEKDQREAIRNAEKARKEDQTRRSMNVADQLGFTKQ